jgi:hypothetical protein
VHFVVIVVQCSHNLPQTENLHHVFFNLDEISSETYEMLTKAFVMKTSVEHNPLDCVHVSKVTKCQLRLLNVQVV